MSMNRDHQAPLLTEPAEPTSNRQAGTPAWSIGAANQSARSSDRAPNVRQHSVELHIEELVLNGFTHSDRYRIGEALEQELTRLLSEEGAPIAFTQAIDIANLNGGAIDLKPGSNPEAAGIQLARAIYGELG